MFPQTHHGELIHPSDIITRLMLRWGVPASCSCWFGPRWSCGQDGGEFVAVRFLFDPQIEGRPPLVGFRVSASAINSPTQGRNQEVSGEAPGNIYLSPPGEMHQFLQTDGGIKNINTMKRFREKSRPIWFPQLIEEGDRGLK